MRDWASKGSDGRRIPPHHCQQHYLLHTAQSRPGTPGGAFARRRYRRTGLLLIRDRSPTGHADRDRTALLAPAWGTVHSAVPCVLHFSTRSRAPIMNPNNRRHTSWPLGKITVPTRDRDGKTTTATATPGRDNCGGGSEATAILLLFRTLRSDRRHHRGRTQSIARRKARLGGSFCDTPAVLAARHI